MEIVLVIASLNLAVSVALLAVVQAMHTQRSRHQHPIQAAQTAELCALGAAVQCEFTR